MGPVRYMTMLRYESKHKSLKEISKRANNFKNITKTISYRHQAELVYNGYTYIDNLDCGKVSEIDTPLPKILLTSRFEKMYEVQWYKINNFKYRQSLAILIKNQFFSIERILLLDDKIYFLIQCLKYMDFSIFTHSIVVEKNFSIEATLIEIEKINEKRPYEMKYLNGKYFIFADTLNVTNTMKN